MDLQLRNNVKQAIVTNDAHSIYIFGLLFYYGEEVEQNYKHAYNLFKKSAMLGNRNAQDRLGDMYQFGKGRDIDKGKAFYWYKKAAEQGHKYAMESVGKKYFYGSGTTQSDKKAVFWLKKAVCHNMKEAQCYLGMLYEVGDGVPLNCDRAIDLYELSAEQGYSFAKRCLAHFYMQGSKEHQDSKKAIYWIREGAVAGERYCYRHMSKLYLYGRIHLPSHVNNPDNRFEKSMEKSILWLTRSAKAGHALSQFKLALYYSMSKRRNNKKAQHWFAEAGKQGVTRATQVMQDFGIEEREDLFSQNKVPEQQNNQQ